MKSIEEYMAEFPVEVYCFCMNNVALAPLVFDNMIALAMSYTLANFVITHEKG